MARCARTLLVRIAAAGLAVIGSLLLSASAASAAGNPLEITAHLGYSDIVKTGAWAPLDVALTNHGSEVDGTLVVHGLLGGRPAVTWPATYQRQVAVYPGAVQHAHLYLSIEQAGMSAQVEVVSHGQVVASSVASATGVTTLVGVLSDNGTALNGLAANNPGSTRVTVVHLGLGDLPASAIPLRAFDLLAFDDVSTDTLSTEQRNAIADYVRGGGALLVGAGESWSRTLGGLPAAILPLHPEGVTLLGSSSALGTTAPLAVATGAMAGGRPWLWDGSLPLLVDKQVGDGSVTLATYDLAPSADPGWTGEDAILRQVLARTLYGGSAVLAAQQVFKGAPLPFAGGGGSLYQRSGTVSSTLGSIPALDLPSLFVTGLIVLVYVVLVGPVNFLALRALRRRALAWITLPVIALLVSAAAYGGAILTKGQSLQINQVAILHLHPGADSGYLEAYTGVISPTRGDDTVRPAAPALVSPISAYFGGGSTTRSDLVVDVGDGSVQLPGVTAFTLRGMGTEEIYHAVPKLTAHLQEANGKLVGTVENSSDLTFTDAVVIAGAGYQTIGQLLPGASAAISVEPKPLTSLGGPGPLMSIYPNSLFGPRNGPPTQAERDGQRKLQILSLITSTGYNGPTVAGGPPVLVAWTTRSLEPVTVNGVHPRTTALTAVALPLTVDQLRAGPVPATAVNGRIVDIDGASSSPGPPGTLVLTSGTVTFDFTPALAPGAQLQGPAIAATSPYFIGKGGPTGSSLVTGQAWDWSTSTWVDVGFQQTASTPLPASAVNPNTGEVRFRVSVNGGSFLAGSLSLTGTVQ